MIAPVQPICDTEAAAIFESLFQRMQCLKKNGFLDIRIMKLFASKVIESIPVLRSFFETNEERGKITSDAWEELDLKLFRIQTGMQRFENDCLFEGTHPSDLFEHFKVEKPCFDDVIQAYCQLRRIQRQLLELACCLGPKLN